MSNLSVTDVRVVDLLEKLRSREWQLPAFQREFVWGVPDVIELLISIFRARPIGMATLWEQGDTAEVALKPIYVMDRDPDSKERREAELPGASSAPAKTFAVLDGRQRCTAIAMAFGGLRPLYTRNRYAGRYYLDVMTNEESRRVRFEKETEVRKKQYHVDARCIADGLFPLTSNQSGEAPLTQWMRYLQAIRDGKFYPNGQLPPESELARRDSILKNAFQGIVDTKLAVYTVPKEYHLGEICEIFEKLNTTGTQVSTVDLIHSWLYSDTSKDSSGPLELRQWIDDFGQRDGAIGWSSSDNRPELVAQLVTACYLAQEPANRPKPRPLSGGDANISSVKANDLLMTPTAHWKQIIANEEAIAEYLRDFQRVVAGGCFPYSECPYPVSAIIYVALRWHTKIDGAAGWARTELDALYPAFFWQNALRNRYDQGFLTQLGADVEALKTWLTSRSEIPNIVEWAAETQKNLDKHMIGSPLPQQEQLIDLLTDGRPAGAMQRAFSLTMVAQVEKDLINPEILLSYPTGEVPELHHIYPKAWCQNNKVGDLAALLDERKAERDWVNSMANLMPLSRESNALWKAKNPGAMLAEKKLTYDSISTTANKSFIDKQSFELLLSGAEGIPKFWQRRAQLMADDLLNRTKITL